MVLRRSAKRHLVLVAAAALSVTAGCAGTRGDTASGKRVIILGYDGMDYGLAKELMAEGRMPNFSRLAAKGSFSPLLSSVPPQSPVAWSDFTTGMGAGGHGIFDFIHRDPETMLPDFSTARTADGTSFKIGKWQIPLSGGDVELLRRGEAFWETLEKHGVETTVMRIPADWPPTGTATRELSGMGTPDILGTYGTFSFYTSDPFPFEGRDIGGGEIYEIYVEDDAVTSRIYGMTNPYMAEPEDTSVEFTVYIDPDEPVAKLVVGEEVRVLKVGEWSDWVRLEFELIPTQSIYGICRFYLKQVRPEFQLYVTPVNIDPMSPAMPISNPPDYAAELAEATGLFYTQGMAEDQKALSAGVFTPQEFLAQAKLVGDENIKQYKYVLDHFEDGLLFYYFGNLDMVSHMMWRPMDPEHPAYDPERDKPFENVVKNLYEELDGLLGYTLERVGDETTVIVMSDHGFTSWRRAFHLNAWLRDNGYLAVIDPDLTSDPGFFMNVDWSRTRAYGLGMNGLYINLRGREKFGIVHPEDKDALMEEIAWKLKETVDPQAGKHPIANVYRSDEVYEHKEQLGIGPDMIVGYAKGWRCSNESVLGEIPPEVITDNTDWWSGDHCIDRDAVPGILLTSRRLRKPAPRLENLAAAVVAEFGIEDFPSGHSAETASARP